MSHFEINKELVLSSCHISEKTYKKLLAGNTNLVAIQDDYCYRVLVTNDNDVDTSKMPELENLLNICRKQECKWLVIDSEGNIHEDLPKFEW